MYPNEARRLLGYYISMRLILICSCLAAIAVIPACSWGKDKKPKSEAHVYSGNSPTLRFSAEQERAGGSLTSY